MTGVFVDGIHGTPYITAPLGSVMALAINQTRIDPTRRGPGEFGDCRDPSLERREAQILLRRFVLDGRTIQCAHEFNVLLTLVYKAQEFKWF
jgi:hypothetical protein